VRRRVDRPARAMKLGTFWTKRNGEPRVFLPALVVVAITFFVGLGITALVKDKPQTDLERATALAEAGSVADAEAMLARVLEGQPTVEVAMALVTVHEEGLLVNQATKKKAETSNQPVHYEKLMSDEELGALIDALPPDVALITRFWWSTVTKKGSEELRNAVIIAADREPPIPWANHALADEALGDKRWAEAVIRFEREGLAFPERAHDIDRSLQARIAIDDWDGVHQRLRDPRYRAHASTSTLHRVAEHDGDWIGVGKYVVVAWFHDTQKWAFIVAGVAALAWAFVCARLGKIGEAPRRRAPLYLVAFALGVLSVIPTLIVISLETTKLKLVESGDATRDILFFVFGVGVREEACKLLLFLPLLPVIRKYGDKLDVLVCGAMVGLGFAAEENLGYLASGNLHTGLARFVTANFFHMAMTGTLAAALDELVTDREKHAMDFTKTAFMVIGMHGAYDFLLSHPEYGGTFMAMMVFVFLTRIFLGAVDRARKKVDRGLSLLHAFVIAIGVVSGVAAVRAVTVVGPVAGAMVLGEGLIGEAIILIVFVRTLGAM
jgi:RsiW-degrading membrane proteinase PrsW (M82 family)